MRAGEEASRRPSREAEEPKKAPSSRFSPEPSTPAPTLAVTANQNPNYEP